MKRKHYDYIPKEAIESITTVKGEVIDADEILDGAHVELKKRVKPTAAKATKKKRWDAVAKEIMKKVNKIWDDMDIESGSQIYGDEDLQKRYTAKLGSEIDSLFQSSTNKEKTLDYLTDWNYHNVVAYLEIKYSAKGRELYQGIYDDYKNTLNPALIKSEFKKGGSVAKTMYRSKSLNEKAEDLVGSTTWNELDAAEKADTIAELVAEGVLAIPYAHGGGIEYNYMLLDRLRSDCDYYLGYGMRNPKHLWAGSVDAQIDEMKRLWNSFPEGEKPEWLSMEDILEYEKKMKSDENEEYAKGGGVKNLTYEIREQVNGFLTPLGYSAKVDDDFSNGEIHIQPDTRKVGNNRSDFFDGMQIIRFPDGTYEVSEYQAGEKNNELFIYKETKSLALALKELIKGNNRKPIKKYAKGGGIGEPKFKKFDIVYYSSEKNPKYLAKVLGSKWDKEEKNWEYVLRDCDEKGNWFGEFPMGLHDGRTPQYQLSLYKKAEEYAKGGGIHEGNIASYKSQLLKDAIRKGDITIDEFSENVYNIEGIAEEYAEQIEEYASEAGELGSSDYGSFYRNFIKQIKNKEYAKGGGVGMNAIINSQVFTVKLGDEIEDTINSLVDEINKKLAKDKMPKLTTNNGIEVDDMERIDVDNATIRVWDSESVNDDLIKFRVSVFQKSYAKGGGVDATILSDKERLELKVLDGLSGFNNGLNINGLLESMGLSNYRLNKRANQKEIIHVKSALSSLIKKGYVKGSAADRGLGENLIDYTITQEGADYRRTFDYGTYAKGGGVYQDWEDVIYKDDRYKKWMQQLDKKTNEVIGEKNVVYLPFADVFRVYKKSYAKGGGVAEAKYKVTFEIDGNKKEKMFYSKEKADAFVELMSDEDDVKSLKLEEVKEEKKTDSLFGMAKAAPPKAASKKEKESVQVKGIASDIARYDELKEIINNAKAEQELIGGSLKQIGKQKFLELYEKRDMKPDNFNLADADEKILFIVMDKYKKVEPEKAAILESYDGLLETTTTYSFNPEVLERIGETVSKIIMESKLLSEEDKRNLLISETTTIVKKGSIDRLMQYDDPAVVFDLIEPVLALK